MDTAFDAVFLQNSILVNFYVVVKFRFKEFNFKGDSLDYINKYRNLKDNL